MDKQKVLAFQTSDRGVRVGAKVYTSVATVNDKADMWLHPAGVYVVIDGQHIIVPYNNIGSMRLEAPAVSVQASPVTASKSAKA